MVNRFRIATLTIFTLLFAAFNSIGQNYHAMQGSSYAGSIGMTNNPASIVNTPYAWDINLFSTQLKYSTNAVTIYNYSLISKPTNSQYAFDAGHFRRYGN